MNYNLGIQEAQNKIIEDYFKDDERFKDIQSYSMFESHDDFLVIKDKMSLLYDELKNHHGKKGLDLMNYIKSCTVKDMLDTTTGVKSEDGTLRLQMIVDNDILTKTLNIGESDGDIVHDVSDSKVMLGRKFKYNEDVESLTFDMEDDSYIVRFVGQSFIPLSENLVFICIIYKDDFNSISHLRLDYYHLSFDKLRGKDFYFREYKSINKLELIIEDN